MKFNPNLVSVLIINFSSGEYIERCVRAVEKQSYSQIEILVIDNGSTDGSLVLVQKMASEGRLRLFAGANVGFSQANNLGIHNSCGEFVLALNADAFLFPDYIEKCVMAFRTDNLIGTVIGKVVSDSDTSVIDSAGIYIYREGVARDRGIGERDCGQYDKQEFVDCALGAAAMYRREMLEDIRIGEEYYDEDFFAFVEDIDLSFRASLSGWRTLYLPSAVARHVRGGSTGNVSEFAHFLSERNTRLFMRKGFRLVARPSDRILQAILLFWRTITLRQYLSAELCGRLRKEVSELERRVDRKHIVVHSEEKISTFSMSGRRSFVAEAILRKATRIQRRILKR